MSVDIYEMFENEIRKEMDRKGLFKPEEGWTDYEWYSKNYKAAERALGQIYEEQEIYELFKDFLEAQSARVTELVACRIEENRSSSFDPAI